MNLYDRAVLEHDVVRDVAKSVFDRASVGGVGNDRQEIDVAVEPRRIATGRRAEQIQLLESRTLSARHAADERGRCLRMVVDRVTARTGLSSGHGENTSRTYEKSIRLDTLTGDGRCERSLAARTVIRAPSPTFAHSSGSKSSAAELMQ